jgi:trigger factor
MEITRESTGELTATIKMVISPSDHQANYTKILKDYQRKANEPGFRPGHVPFGIIKKQYGPAVFADEINKLISEKLHQYISDEKLDILGQPLANITRTEKQGFLENQDMEFYFDLGLAPTFDIQLNDTLAVDYYIIKVDETQVDKEVVQLATRFGELVNTEIAGEKDILFGKLEQLDEEGNVLGKIISNHPKVAIEQITDSATKSKMIGAKIGDEIVLNPLKAAGNEADASAIFGIGEEDFATMDSDFRYHINEISTMAPASMDSVFFDKVFPEVGIETEAEFRNKIRNEIEKSYLSSSDHLFTHHLQEKLIEVTGISMPDDFIKRFLAENGENKLSVEEIEKDYQKYNENMKWQLIENKIIINENISVTEDEIKDTVKDMYWQGWRSVQLPENLLEKLDVMADKFIKDKPNEVRRLTDSIYMQKIISLAKSKVTLVEKEISYDEFLKIDAEKH